MKKRLILISVLLFLFSLSGCSQNQTASWETVNDVIPVLSTEPASNYRITFAVPEDAVIAAAGDDQNILVYTGEKGDYEITAQRVEADSIQTVAKEISGFRFDQLSPMCWKQGEMDRYDFVWSSAQEDGQMVHRAAVLEDDGAYYVLTFSMSEDTAGGCQEKVDAAFSSLGLCADEGF